MRLLTLSKPSGQADGGSYSRYWAQHLSQHVVNTCFPVSTLAVLTPIFVSQQLPLKADLCTNVNPQTLLVHGFARETRKRAQMQRDLQCRRWQDVGVHRYRRHARAYQGLIWKAFSICIHQCEVRARFQIYIAFGETAVARSTNQIALRR